MNQIFIKKNFDTIEQKVDAIIKTIEFLFNDAKGKNISCDYFDEFIVFNETIRNMVSKKCQEKGIIMEGPDAEKKIYGWRFSRIITEHPKEQGVVKNKLFKGNKYPPA